MSLNSLKTFFPLMVLSVLLILSACSDGGQELVIGSHENEERVVFFEDRTLNDQDSIEEFKNIITTSTDAADKVNRLPDYVVAINNKDESTMEVLVNFWLQKDGTIIFTRGFGGDEYYMIDEENTKRVNAMIDLQ